MNNKASRRYDSAFEMTTYEGTSSRALIHNTREGDALDRNGFPMARTSSHVNAFDEEPKLWSVPDPKKKQEDDSQWFFNHIDDTHVELEPRQCDKGPKPKVKWDKNDDDLLDFLLRDEIQSGDTKPGLCLISSFEDPAWEITKDSGLDDFSYISGTSFFDEQALDRAKAKNFDPSTSTSTESGNNVSTVVLEPFVDDFGDGISAITSSTAISQAQQSPIPSIEPLDAWPDDEVGLPLLIQVPVQEMARRIEAMQQQMKSEEELESLSESQDETVRLEGEVHLPELWITSNGKKTKRSLSQDQSTTTLVWI